MSEFEELYADLPRHTSQLALIRASNRIDRFVRREALVLFLYAPQSLCAVNRHVDFTPYRTSFELAECEVGEGHWSRRQEPAAEESSVGGASERRPLDSLARRPKIAGINALRTGRPSPSFDLDPGETA